MTVQSLTDAMKDFPVRARVEVWREISQWRVGDKSSIEEIIPMSESLSRIVAEAKAGIDIISLLLCPDPVPQMFFDNVQRLAKKWSNPIDGNLASAIAARDKITWDKDCWGDVNRLIVAKNFEDAIEMARLYEEQNQLRTKGKSLGSFEESGN